MKKNNSVISRITDWKKIIIIQIVASVVLGVFVFKLGALPPLYFGIMVGVLALLTIGMFFMMKPSKQIEKGKTRSIVGKLISIVLSMLLLLASLYIVKGDSALGNISGADKQVTRYAVLVLKDSEYTSLSDLKNYSIETSVPSDEASKLEKVFEEMYKVESTLDIKDIEDIAKLSNNLVNKQTEAILINESWMSMLEASREDFKNEVKEIWSFEIEEELVDFSKKASVTKEPFTIYISGIDTTGPVSTVSRSDVNLILTVNPVTKQVLLTSIPRDYFVPLANKNNVRDKLTHAGNGGIKNVVETVENYMGIEINYYAKVNFTSLVEIVDALGGVTVNSPVAFTTRHGNYEIVAGDNYMDGVKALAFVRERYNLSGGDIDRGKNQMRLITAMLKKMMSPAILTNYSSVLNSIEGSFETNMSQSEITDIIQMQLNDMASWTFIDTQLTGTGQTRNDGAYMPGYNLYYMIPNEDSVAETKKIIKEVMAGKTIE